MIRYAFLKRLTLPLLALAVGGLVLLGSFAASIAHAATLTRTSSFAYDPASGLLTKEVIEPDSSSLCLVTEYVYDGYGNKVSATTRNCNGSSGEAAAPTGDPVIQSRTTSNGYDARGQFPVTSSNALSQSETKTYDARFGAVLSLTGPNGLTYDALSRVIQVVDADSAVTTTAYNGLSVTVTNPKNQTRSTVKNSQGQIVSVADAQNNTLAYQYDPFGNLTQTTDPLGNNTVLTYDLRGRKTQMQDPDMGTWTYAYDALGQLVRQTDAKSQVTTQAYDQLGRMVSRSESDLISYWYYDTGKNNAACPKGIGKLCQAETSTGYNRVHGYDTLGRSSGTSTSVDTAYSTSVAYDAHGRVATQTLPGGIGVAYVYTTLGYLKKSGTARPAPSTGRRTPSMPKATCWPRPTATMSRPSTPTTRPTGGSPPSSPAPAMRCRTSPIPTTASATSPAAATATRASPRASSTTELPSIFYLPTRRHYAANSCSC